MPPPRRSLQPRFTEQTPSLKAATELATTHGDTLSLVPPSHASLVWAKAPRVATKGESLCRAGQAHAQVSVIVSPSHNGRHNTRWANARGMTETLKSTGASTGRSAPRRSSVLTAESDRETTARVRSARSFARARSAEPCPCPSPQTFDRAASLRYATAAFTGESGEAVGASGHPARASRLASAQAHYNARLRAYARPQLSEAGDAVIAGPEGRAVCASPARDVSYTHSISSPVLHPSVSVSFAEAASHLGHPRNFVASAAPTRDGDSDNKSCPSLPPSPSSTTAVGSATRYDTEGPAALDKPWLGVTPVHGILKGRGRMNSTTRVASSAVSSTGCTSSSHRAHTLSSVPKAVVRDPSARSLSNPETISVQESARQARHVTFDEAAIKYLDAYESHVYDDSRLGRHLENVECGTPMLLSCAVRDFRRCQPPTTTEACMRKENADNWDADSEWFNEEFGAQLTLTGATADSAKAAPTQSSSAAARESPPLQSAVLIKRPSRVLISSSSALLSSSANTAATAATAARGATRQLGKPGRMRDEYDSVGSCQSLGTPRSSFPSRTPRGTSTVMNTHHASAPFGAPTAASSSTVTAGEASEPTSDDGRDSSPVLAYENASFIASTRSVNHSVVVSSLSRSTVAPAPPLSVSDLRRRSPAASTSLSPSECSGASGSRRGSSHRRLSSPRVSLSNVEAALDKVAESEQGARSTKQEISPVPPRTQAVAANQHDGESPTLGAMRLSMAERRLLQAVIQSNERKHPTDRAATSSVVPSRTTTGASPALMAEMPSGTLSSGAGGALSSNSVSTSSLAGGGVRALRETTPALGNPHANVLSAEVREFLDASAPSLSSITSRRSRANQPASVDEAGSAYSSARTQVFHAQLSSTCSTATPPAATAATSAVNGNPGSTTVLRANSISSALSPSLFPSAEPAVSKAGGNGSQMSRKDDTVIAAPSALSSEARRSRTITSHLHNHRLGMPALQLAHPRSGDGDKDEDESEPHIQVPVPLPRTPPSKSSWAAQ
ncbi:hypothetical protein, unknown function [Leishmania mexicana MHOM/GT/2001/U1103]|uniref:Uncharacterized protein n=1 Tax=Leishmania mexicana (strain MHOM/GT/2001/U1103) TaxID=929439 RepID=E9ALR3_LEIMU|nr:hypothetical protein, unknown function [Leishmania mexicana MHOM/GT/2001/U1103]CBZ23868.1 hypothetical protein, unknown function [Leishmania mexicana MHOM/GT/2001/U1103]